MSGCRARWNGRASRSRPASSRSPYRPASRSKLSISTAMAGPNKAVYAYPAEHYAYWRRELPDQALPWGVFGENLTTEGLFEDTQIGDRFRIGSTEVMATQPRLPCYKLGLRFGRDDIVKRFLASGLTGFYFKVIVEGDVGAGDTIVLIRQATDSLPVSEITRLYAHDTDDLEGLRHVVKIADLAED